MYYLIESRKNYRVTELHIFTSKSARKTYYRDNKVNLLDPMEHEVTPKELTQTVNAWTETGQYFRPQKIKPIEIPNLQLIFH